MPQTDERPLPDFVKDFPPEIAEQELQKRRQEANQPVPLYIEDDREHPDDR